MDTENTVAVPPFRIVLEGALNVRDIGGYATKDGHSVRRGVFYRADSLHKLSEADQKVLLDLGIRTIIDLRYDDELAQSPNVFANSPDVSYQNISLFTQQANLDPTYVPPIPTTVPEMYRLLLQTGGEPIRLVMTHLASSPAPALFHCTAGKDRTGIIAALLLDVAGVEVETIAADYGRTQEYLAPILEEILKGVPEQFAPMLAINPAYMLETMEYIHQEWGSSAGYLDSIGMRQNQIDQLRVKLIE